MGDEKPDYVSKTNIAQKILVKELVKRDTVLHTKYFTSIYTLQNTLSNTFNETMRVMSTRVRICLMYKGSHARKP